MGVLASRLSALLSYKPLSQTTHPETRIITEPSVLTNPRAEIGAELERLHADCVGWALACCAFDRSEADDVLQTSYLKVLEGRAVYREGSSFKTWFFGVIKRTAAEHRRRAFFRRLAFGRSLDGVDIPESGSVTPALDADDVARLIGALRLLPRRQREVLHLVFYQDLTIQESALVLHVSLGSARTHYERGKRRLRELLGEQE
jgi:RNA polymerase sigma-70 factor (ECF subfamily)